MQIIWSNGLFTSKIWEGKLNLKVDKAYSVFTLPTYCVSKAVATILDYLHYMLYSEYHDI
jgi:hypothetical protein